MNIAIHFPDRDFQCTLRNFLEILALSDITVEYLGYNTKVDKDLSKSQIVELFNELAFGLYLLYQKQYRYEQPQEHLRTYLKIKESNVYINDEVVKCLEEEKEDLYILMDNRIFST